MAKTVNYTDEMTKEMVTAYSSADSDESRASVVETFAEKFGKTVASVRMKLSREGVYVKKERTTKTGDKITRKSSIVDSITDVIEMTEADATSLEKANKTALEAIFKFVVSKS